MAHDISRAVPQPTTEPATHPVGLPTPRQSLQPPPPAGLPPPRQSLEPSTHDAARPAPEPAAHDIPQPASPPPQGSRAGWIVSAVVAAAAAWAVGWVAGVSWAWREMTPRYLRRH